MLAPESTFFTTPLTFKWALAKLPQSLSFMKLV